MTYLDYIVFFEKLDRQQAFSGNATRLYLKLLALANEIGWPAEFAKPDPYVSAVCGFSRNTMRECRAQLATRGLVSIVPGGSGRGDATNYKLLGRDKVSKSNTLQPEKVSNSDTLNSSKVSKPDTLQPENGQKGSGKVSDFDTPYIDKEKESSSAASAATSPSSLSSEKAAPKKPRAKGASHEEIAALPLPFTGADFAEAWRTFYTSNTKQAGKALTAFGLMLKKLGKYPEGFAVLMLERAIMSNWQGVEHGGTPRDFAEWKAEQARQPPAPPPTTGQPISLTLELNEEFEAEQRARDQAEATERARQFRATYANPDTP